MQPTRSTTPVSIRNKGIKGFLMNFVRQRYLVLMSFPFVIWLFIFRYLPLWGWMMAFQDYKPGIPFFRQQWVGLKYFRMMFQDPEFYLSLRNTLAMSFLTLVAGFTLPVIFAVLLNEIRNTAFKRTIQTLTYLPHFVSWVVVASIFKRMLSIDGGVINEILVSAGILQEPYQFMAKPGLFWIIMTVADTWKELGWNSILFLAAIANIPSEQYESATVDGAGRFRKTWHVTLPGMMPAMVVILVLSIGNLMNTGFERQFLMRNDIVRDVANVLDLYILDYGVNLGRYSFGTATGIFKSVVSVILVVGANMLSKKAVGYKVV